MLEKLIELQKWLESDYWYYPDVVIELIREGRTVVIRIGDFIGEGRDAESAFKDLLSETERYYKEETDFEEEMFDFFEEIKGGK